MPHRFAGIVNGAWRWSAFVAEGFVPGVMYQNYGEELSEQEIADLVAFMMTLK